MKKRLFSLLFLLFCPIILANMPSDEPIAADQAFTLTATTFGPDTLNFQWQIKPGYYLYKERVHFQLYDSAYTKIGQILSPPGQPEENEILGKYQIYTDTLSISVPIIFPDPSTPKTSAPLPPIANQNQNRDENDPSTSKTTLNLSPSDLKEMGRRHHDEPPQHSGAYVRMANRDENDPSTSKTMGISVNYQGCARTGYCYPPITRYFNVNFTQNIVTPVDSPNQNTITVHTENNQQQPFIRLLSTHHIFRLLLAFFGFGVLLSLTPCVLPMLPILSGIIMGHQKTVLKSKALKLSMVYVLSMATTYALAGLLIGWLGGNLQSAFQQPWVISLFSALFVGLALSFFGLYTIQLPAYVEERIANIRSHQKSGHYIGVAVMGCLATLMVSPCITPALVGVLGYISQTGNSAIGGVALFAMGLGMGLPLILLGLAGKTLLPKAGPWMQTLEYIFGVLFLGMAIWMLSRILPGSVTLALWGCLSMGCSVYLGTFSQTSQHGWHKILKSIGLLAFVYSIFLLIGAAQGNTNLLQPLSNIPSTAPQTHTNNAITFTPIKKIADIQATLDKNSIPNKPILLEFYADWCISCQEMQATTFKDPQVLALLNQFTLLKADVTQNDAIDKQLMQHFQVIAPPTFLMLDSTGKPLTRLTRVGKMDSAEFINYLTLNSPVSFVRESTP